MLFIILLVAAIVVGGYLAISALYDGGDSLTENTARTQANQIINGVSQIEQANIEYSLFHGGEYAETLANLVDDNRLSREPRMPANTTVDYTRLSDNTVSVSGVTDSQCKAVNSIAGYGSEIILDGEGDVTEGFGCHTDTADNVFVWNP